MTVHSSSWNTLHISSKTSVENGDPSLSGLGSSLSITKRDIDLLMVFQNNCSPELSPFLGNQGCFCLPDFEDSGFAGCDTLGSL
ncbi:hypothetical protein HanRHA438_Chr11g0492171 [Helianthus annuus]|nr:hypothetical protein HanRHA438_Chr11g0492171 [Helianthus annuus]